MSNNYKSNYDNILNINSMVKSLIIYIIVFCFSAPLFIACSDLPDEKSVYLSGTVKAKDINGPAFVTIVKANEANSFENANTNNVVDLIQTDKEYNSFGIELSNKGLAAGDTVMVIAYVDRDYQNGIPAPSPGDYVGVYIDPDRLSPSYILSNGKNDHVNININREVFSFNADVKGKVSCREMGNLMLIAYAGEIVSSDFTNFDFDYVIGYFNADKNRETQDFKIDIWPYGFNVPIENVFLFALLDVNQNKTIDKGDRFGYLSDEDGIPFRITVNKGSNNLDHTIELTAEVKESQNYDISLSGNVSIPEDYYQNNGDNSLKPLYIIVSDVSSDVDSSASSIKYFEKLPPENRSYNIDLSSTDLKPGDQIMVFTIWDRDYNGGFPNLSKDDSVGFYINKETASPSIKLSDGNNGGIDINFNRRYISFDAEIRGNVLGEEAGDLFITAYAGELLSSDLKKLDFDSIIGFQTLSKEESEAGFQIKVQPFMPQRLIKQIQTGNKLDDVFLVAFLDINRNGTIDEGDKFGYLADENNLPLPIPIEKGTNDLDEILQGKGIELSSSITSQAEYDISLSSYISVPKDYVKGNGGIFITVSQMDDFDYDNPFSSIKYFEKLSYGQDRFTFDLSRTGLAPGDKVMLYAFWDKDYQGGMPFPKEGDDVGYCQNKKAYLLSNILEEGHNFIDPSEGWEFKINKKLYDHDATITFTLENGDLPLA